MKSHTKILLRFDDVCPTMDNEQFIKAVAIMDEYNIKPLIGVIPECCDSDLMLSKVNKNFWEYVIELQQKGYTVAMHGVNHTFNSPHRGIVNNRIGSEFAGLSLEEQITKIQKGKEILLSHGIKTDIFFAPAHSYDLNTIKALVYCGFKYMSDGKSASPYQLYGLNILPCRASGCPQIKKKSMYTAVFHAHEWGREDKRYCYEQFVNLIKNYQKNIVSFSEYSTVKYSNSIIQQFNEFMFVRYERYIYPILSKIYHKLLRK